MKRITCVVIVLILMIMFVSGCGNDHASKGVPYNLYFSNLEKNNLVIEQRNIISDGIEDTAKTIVEELIKGPEINTNLSLIPKETKLLGLEVENGVAMVNFSIGYFPSSTDADVIELLARYSIVHTLCDIDGIDKVKIFIDGIELTSSSGVPVGALGKEDVLLDSSATHNSETIDVCLYFPDTNALNLYKEVRNVPVIDNSVEKTIVMELIKGPETDELASTIPAETKVISVETKEKICFVNLSNEFVKNHANGSTAEVYTVYSIVNSLTELKDIESVQFLVEGEKVDVLRHMLLDAPYFRDESYIKK